MTPVARPVVLIVEDEPHLRAALVREMREHGFDARPCKTVAEARALLSQAAAILLDWNLEGDPEHPLELAHDAPCPVVFHTASAWIIEGTWTVIQKPATPSVIAAALRAAITSRGR